MDVTIEAVGKRRADGLEGPSHHAWASSSAGSRKDESSRLIRGASGYMRAFGLVSFALVGPSMGPPATSVQFTPTCEGPGTVACAGRVDPLASEHGASPLMT